MQITEDEYYILSELIGMDDRQLAQKIELLIWSGFPPTQGSQFYMDELIRLMNDCPTAIQFYEELTKWVESKGVTFGSIKSEDAYKCGLPGTPKVTLGQPRINARGEPI